MNEMLSLRPRVRGTFTGTRQNRRRCRKPSVSPPANPLAPCRFPKNKSAIGSMKHTLPHQPLAPEQGTDQNIRDDPIVNEPGVIGRPQRCPQSNKPVADEENTPRLRHPARVHHRELRQVGRTQARDTLGDGGRVSQAGDKNCQQTPVHEDRVQLEQESIL